MAASSGREKPVRRQRQGTCESQTTWQVHGSLRRLQLSHPGLSSERRGHHEGSNETVARFIAFVDSFGAVRTLSGASSPLLGAECQTRCTRSSSHRSSWSVKARSGCGVRAASAALSNSDRAWTVGAAKRGGHVANRAWRASFVDVGSNNYQIFPPAPTCRSVFLPLLAR